ncbi:MAG: TonB-dependent receptor [Caulobacter sp.]|nr:TonB-dependent receptor [Caulobacter sp.]
MHAPGRQDGSGLRRVEDEHRPWAQPGSSAYGHTGGQGALRGYLANIEEVEVKGVEVDLSATPIDALKLNLSVAYSDGEYVSFANGPCPLEKIGTAASVCGLSGHPLPGLSDWVVTYGGEYRQPVTLGTLGGEAYVGVDASYRSDFYSDASVSKYALIKGYTVVNGRIGLRSDGPWEVSIWAKNLLDEEYLQFTSVQAGNSGLILGNPGDPRTYGLTLKAKY